MSYFDIDTSCSSTFATICVANPDPFDADWDPAFNFATDPDPAFQFDTDPAVFEYFIYLFIYLYGSGSLPFKRSNAPTTVFFIHFYLIFLVSRSHMT
jgi:hypothetical protein